MIKALFFSLFSTMLFSVNTLETDHFSISDRQVIWQKVFETTLTKDQVIQNIRYSGNFNNISVHGDYLTADIPMLSIDHDGYESSIDDKAPAFAAFYHVKAYAIIEFKQGKYRITLKSIKLTPRIISGDSSNRIFDLASIAIGNDNDQFKANFFKRRSKILNHTFLQLANFAEKETVKW